MLGGLSEKNILLVFCDVCEAIAQFHHCQPPIIHRDIKVCAHVKFTVFYQMPLHALLLQQTSNYAPWFKK